MRPPRQKGAVQRLNDIIDAHRCIKSKYLDRERELQETKWYPYRFISAYRATMIFVREFECYYKRAFAQHFDKRIQVRPVNRQELHKPSRIMTHAWIGRQQADALGMPYALYLEFFDNFLLRRGKRKHLPQMNQLQGSPSAKKDWPKQLEKFLLERGWHQLMTIESPQLHTDNYSNLPAQSDFRAWAIDVIKTAGKSYRHALEDVSFRKCLLPPPSFLSLLDKETYASHIEILEAERKHGRLVPEVAEKVDSADLLPGCFGLVEVAQEQGQLCSSCVFARKCGIFRAQASIRMKNDPDFLTADDLKRKFDRERQAEHRKRKKNAAA